MFVSELQYCQSPPSSPPASSDEEDEVENTSWVAHWSHSATDLYEQPRKYCDSNDALNSTIQTMYNDLVMIIWLNETHCVVVLYCQINDESESIPRRKDVFYFSI